MPRRTPAQLREAALERHRRQSLERARTLRRESRYLDFKERFDPLSKAEWCEVVKELVAIANTGGGVIVFGVKNNGKSARADLKPILSLDPAKIVDQVFRYTGEHFAGFDIVEVKRGRSRAVAVVIDPAEIPLIFSNPGTYPIEGDAKGRQHTAFSRGTLYVRHGAKSEPARTSDLARIINRHRDEVRDSLMRDLRRVVEGPADAEIVRVRRGDVEDGVPTTIQVTTDPGAPVYGKLAPDKTHPYLQRDVVSEVNRRLGGDQAINRGHVQYIRTVYGLNAETAPEYVHKPKFGSNQYSDAFVAWIVERVRSDPDFLDDARRRFYEQRRSG